MQNLELKNIEMGYAKFHVVKEYGENTRKAIAEAIVWAIVNGTEVVLEAESKSLQISPTTIIDTIYKQCQE